MKKQITSLLLIIAILTATMPLIKTTLSATTITGSGWSYESDTETLTITTNEGINNWRGSDNTYFKPKDVRKAVVKDGVTIIDGLIQSPPDYPPLEYDNAASADGTITSLLVPVPPPIIYGAFSSCESLVSVTLPDSLTSIGYVAFMDCKKLTEVTLPKNVTSIGYSAFASCDALAEVNLPKSLVSIDKNAFVNCKSLSDIKVDIDNENFSASNGVLFNKDKSVLYIYPRGKTETTYKIPNTVKKIETRAFELSKNLTSIDIPDNVTDICDYAFKDCERLRTVTIGSIKAWTYYGAFDGCRRITTFITGCGDYSKFTSLGTGIESLTAITFTSEKPPVFAENAFDGAPKLKTIYVPVGAKAAYESASKINDVPGAPLEKYTIIEGKNPNIPVPAIPCDDCKLCKSDKKPVKGCILGEKTPEIHDFIEILKFLVRIESAIDECVNSLDAALITDKSKEKGVPEIFDGIAILEHLVKLTDITK
ncbi:MAG: leucine-rich repeat domain-containing protein [Oscillospiraceae bacterium]|nr:leucine-rich repeat domain-containing protein [Oscillospiraceae bacterium]